MTMKLLAVDVLESRVTITQLSCNSYTGRLGALTYGTAKRSIAMLTRIAQDPLLVPRTPVHILGMVFQVEKARP